jgi:hypothetical protein
MPPNNNIFYTKTFKNKSWANYQYELDQAKSPAEKKAARNEYNAIIADGMRQKEENDKKKGNVEVRKWNLEKKSKEEERKEREEKQQKEAEEKRKVKEAEKAARKAEKAKAEREKAEAIKKGDINTLKKLNIASKTALLKKLGRQTKKCKWEHEKNGCWAHKEGKCPFKHNCNNAKKGGTRKLRR